MITKNFEIFFKEVLNLLSRNFMASFSIPIKFPRTPLGINLESYKILRKPFSPLAYSYLLLFPVFMIL